MVEGVQGRLIVQLLALVVLGKSTRPVVWEATLDYLVKEQVARGEQLARRAAEAAARGLSYPGQLMPAEVGVLVGRNL